MWAWKQLWPRPGPLQLTSALCFRVHGSGCGLRTHLGRGDPGFVSAAPVTDAWLAAQGARCSPEASPSRPSQPCCLSLGPSQAAEGAHQDSASWSLIVARKPSRYLSAKAPAQPVTSPDKPPFPIGAELLCLLAGAVSSLAPCPAPTPDPALRNSCVSGGGKTAVCQCWAGDFPALDGSPAASRMRWVAATSGSEHHLIFLPTTPSHPMRGAGVTGQGHSARGAAGAAAEPPRLCRRRSSAESSPRGIPEQEGGGPGRSRHAPPPSKLQTSRRALGGRRGDVPGPDPAGRPGSASSRPRPSPAGRYSSGHG